MIRLAGVIVCALLATVAFSTRAATQIEDLRKEVEKLRHDVAAKNEGKTAIGRVDGVTQGKYGPNSAVTTRAGKLNIGGLVQVWYQSVQNDNVGINKLSPIGDFTGESNEVNDNDTFRIRRAELHFSLDIHENVSAFVLVDPARETNIGFYPLPTFRLHNTPFGNPVFAQTGAGLQGGNTIIPQLLQDAYINFHGVVPHHDFTIGQFKPPSGEEAWRSSAHLDFVERSMVGAVNNIRDIGAMVHGSWIDGRVQYWVGAFNGPNGTLLTDPDITEGGNRSDDNDEKDLAFRIAVRPVWNPDCWYGRLELGYHRTDGIRGESAGVDRDTPVNGLNIPHTDVNRTGAWAWYRPGGPVRGTWLRGEWGSSRDRFWFNGIGTPTTNFLGIGSAADSGQLKPTPVTLSGWYFAAGYKMSESRFAECLKNGNGIQKALHDMEFAFRYEAYENIVVEDLVNPDRHSDVFKTQAYTAGINYYIKGHNAKIQANYIWVDEPSDGNVNRGLREVRNDVFVVNFQVYW